jgi:hypothetical protein
MHSHALEDECEYALCQHAFLTMRRGRAPTLNITSVCHRRSGSVDTETVREAVTDALRKYAALRVTCHPGVTKEVMQAELMRWAEARRPSIALFRGQRTSEAEPRVREVTINQESSFSDSVRDVARHEWGEPMPLDSGPAIRVAVVNGDGQSALIVTSTKATMLPAALERVTRIIAGDAAAQQASDHDRIDTGKLDVTEVEFDAVYWDRQSALLESGCFSHLDIPLAVPEPMFAAPGQPAAVWQRWQDSTVVGNLQHMAARHGMPVSIIGLTTFAMALRTATLKSQMSILVSPADFVHDTVKPVGMEWLQYVDIDCRAAAAWTDRAGRLMRQIQEIIAQRVSRHDIWKLLGRNTDRGIPVRFSADRHDASPHGSKYELLTCEDGMLWSFVCDGSVLRLTAWYNELVIDCRTIEAIGEAWQSTLLTAVGSAQPKEVVDCESMAGSL